MSFAAPLSLTNGKSPARGRMARQVAGAENVEIKATVEAHNVRKALKLLGLAPGKGEVRLVYFFDTPRLELFQSGTIVRARRVPGGGHDSTVKIRPVDPGKVPAKWPKDKGFKLEADAGETAIVRSASLSRPLPKGLIKDVTAGKDRVSELFDSEQELFLAEMCRIRYDLDQLAILGPISALWWKIEHPGLPYDMTAELWTREDRESMLEVSIRVPAAQAAFAAAGFLAFLAELGAERENAQQAKTRWALEFYAGRISGRAKGKGQPKAKAKVRAAKQAAEEVVKKKKVVDRKVKQAMAATRGPRPAAKPGSLRVARSRGLASARKAAVGTEVVPTPVKSGPAADAVAQTPATGRSPLPRRSMHVRTPAAPSEPAATPDLPDDSDPNTGTST